jgi:DNA sulfur modification protein DndB
MPNTYAFAAISGVQAGRAYYVAMVPLKLVGRLFSFDDEDLPAAIRSQRDLNKGRVPGIARYICDHSDQYVMPALSATIDGGFRFEAASAEGADRSVGTLLVDMQATLLINDGQHRRAGIVEAVRERPHLGDETIAVILYPDLGLERSQQMFVDLNQHGVRPARSLRLLYDGRDEDARLTRRVVESVPVLRDMTDYSRSNLGPGSPKLFAFSNVHSACRTLVAEAGLDVDPDQPDEVVAFWTAVTEAMPDWQLAHRGRLAAGDLRRDKVHAHGLALEAIAMAGARLRMNGASEWRTPMARLETVDWSRANAGLWEGRALLGGRISRSRTSIVLTADVIFRELAGMSDDASKQVG